MVKQNQAGNLPQIWTKRRSASRYNQGEGKTMADIVPYIYFAKNGQEAIKFYKGVFGGDAEVQFDGERVIHLDFQAGGIHFMGSTLQSDQAERGNSSNLVLNCDSEEQLRDFYTRLVYGGKE